ADPNRRPHAVQPSPRDGRSALGHASGELRQSDLLAQAAEEMSRPVPEAGRPGAAVTLVAGLVLLGACDALDARERFVMATDEASRYSFRYIQDRQTGKWVQLHCEIRVPVSRKLPDPITSSETGDLLHFTEFGEGTMGSAGVDKNEQEIRDGYRVWLWRDTPGEAHYKGKAGFGIQVTWPDPGAEARHEPLENFNLPAMRTMSPYVW